MTKNDKKQIVTTIDPTMMEAIDELVSTTGISKSGLVRRALQHEINDGANAPAGALAMVELQNQINNTEDYLPKENFIELLVAMDNLTKSLTMAGVD